jgi:hypothetical protein
MAEVTNETLYRLALEISANLEALGHGLDEVRNEMRASGGHLVAVQQDIHNIYTTLARHETRLDRIDRRLGLLEPTAP